MDGSFNEGRGFTPGDTVMGTIVVAASGTRSMRAGGSPPATLSACLGIRVALYFVQ